MTIDGPFDNLSSGRTLSRTFSIWMDRSRYFTSIGLVVLAPVVISTVTVAVTVVQWYLKSKSGDPNFHPPSLPARVMVQCVAVSMFVLLLIAILIGEGAAAIGVVRLYIGQSPTIGESFREAWSRKYVLFGSIVIEIVAATVGMLAMVLAVPIAGASMGGLVNLVIMMGGVYAYMGVCLTSEVIVAEGISSSTQAIHRSWELASGNRCYISCTMCLLVLIQAIFLQIFQLVVFSTGKQLGASGFVVGGLVQVVPQCCLFFPLQVILKTVVYLNLRVRKESLNHEVLSNDLMKDGWSHRHQELLLLHEKVETRI